MQARENLLLTSEEDEKMKVDLRKEKQKDED